MTIKAYVRKIQYYETDMMGIAHHANYIHWMEEARIDFMDQLGVLMICGPVLQWPEDCLC